MAVQTKETMAFLFNPEEKREFGPWKINIPSKKKALLNCLNLWFIMIRLFEKIKTLMLSLIHI